MAVAGEIEITVVDMRQGPHYSGFWQADTTDPYVKLILHDGKFAEGGSHVGEQVKTTVKDDAGSEAKWNETFKLNKPENMDVLRVELWDSNVLIDDYLGSLDVDLKVIFAEEVYKQESGVSKSIVLVKDGKETAHVDLKIKIKV